MEIKIDFKNPADERIFYDDAQFDPRLRQTVWEIAYFANRNGFVLMVTGIHRTKAEQVKIYGQDQPSGHRETPTRAIDFRTSNLSDGFILKLLKYYEDYLDAGEYYSMLRHVGTADHLHVQVPRQKYNLVID